MADCGIDFSFISFQLQSIYCYNIIILFKIGWIPFGLLPSVSRFGAETEIRQQIKQQTELIHPISINYSLINLHSSFGFHLRSSVEWIQHSLSLFSHCGTFIQFFNLLSELNFISPLAFNLPSFFSQFSVYFISDKLRNWSWNEEWQLKWAAH